MACEVVDEWCPAYWRHPGTPHSQMGRWESLPARGSQRGWMRVGLEWGRSAAWAPRWDSSGQNSLQRVISHGSHLTSGEWRVSQGRPRMTSTVGPSSTRKVMVSSCRHPTHSFKGGAVYLTRPNGFPRMVSTRSSWAWRLWGRWRQLRKSCDMNCPRSPSRQGQRLQQSD